MQTTVEFIVEKLNKLETEKHLYKVIDYRIKKQIIIEEAKQMFEQQIIDAVNIDKRQYDNAQHYFAETYGSKGSDETKTK